MRNSFPLSHNYPPPLPLFQLAGLRATETMRKEKAKVSSRMPKTHRQKRLEQMRRMYGLAGDADREPDDSAAAAAASGDNAGPAGDARNPPGNDDLGDSIASAALFRFDERPGLRTPLSQAATPLPSAPLGTLSLSQSLDMPKMPYGTGREGWKKKCRDQTNFHESYKLP